jgi:hypothetical protein
MKLSEHFNNVFSYSQGVEQWCRNLYKDMSGNDMNYTFVSDFALDDFYGDTTRVEKLYERIKKEWMRNYKAFTEVCVSINLLAWANDKLSQQGIEGRETFTEFYSDLYYKAKDEFYEFYKYDNEAKDYFFSMTD